MAIRESESQTSGDFSSSVFSMAFGRSSIQTNPSHCPGGHSTTPWPSLSTRTSLWTKYCLLCTVCGSAATILAGIFLIVAALLRYHTTSIHYFETVPTYAPSILLSISGISTIAFSCKRNRNIILLRITACWSLCSAALASVITITTSLIHMNRLQTLKECVFTRNPPTCTCFGHAYGPGTLEGLTPPGTEPLHFVFENTLDCDVIHGVLYSCLRAVFAISVLAVLLSIFLCMLLYQLIGHERKKAYWTRIRRINSDWSSDFLSSFTRQFPHDSSILPLMASRSRSMGLGLHGTASMISMGIPGIPVHGLQWGPPPPYEPTQPTLPTDRNRDGEEPRSRLSLLSSQTLLPGVPGHLRPNPPEGLESEDGGGAELCCVNAFSPTITTIVHQEPLTTRPRLLLRESKITIQSTREEDEVRPVSDTSRTGMTPGGGSLPSSPFLTNITRLLRRQDNRRSGEGGLEGGTKPSQSLPGSPLRVPLRSSVERLEFLEKDMDDLC